MEKATVYFTKELTAEAVTRLYAALGCQLPGKVAVKVHSGELGNQNFIRPDFLAPMITQVQGTIVECNTAYEGKRYTTEDHLETIKTHGWLKVADVDIMDADGDMELSIPDGKHIHKNYVGKHLANYDSMLVLSHFKGHAMGGFGGALKNISIGVASSHGKAYIHGAGEPEKIWSSEQILFVESMADAAKSVHEYFKDKIAYINIMANISVDCDCDAHARPPQIGDIGILSSLDPVALDQACLDLVYALDDPNKADLIARIEEMQGAHILETAAETNTGSRQYELIQL